MSLHSAETILDERMTFLLYIRISDFQSHLDRHMTKTMSKDSDQPGHLHPVWSVLAVRIKKPWILSYPLSTQQRFWSDWVDAQLIWVFAGCTGNFVGLVTVWLLFSFNAHKIWFLRFQRHVQLFRIKWVEVMIMKKQHQWRAKHNAKKIKCCDRHYFWVQHYWFSCAASSVALKWARFRAFYKWLLTKYGDLFCQRTISVFC